MALVAAGPSKSEWLNLMCASELRGPMVDEVWGIKLVARAIRADLAFGMDDYATYRGHNPTMTAFYEDPPCPLITSVARPNCPKAISYPLADVLSMPGVRADYLNHTVAYALAYAILIGVKNLFVFGADYLEPSVAPERQTGSARYLACAAYWLGQAEARGMNVVVCPHSPLLDADIHKTRLFYGYMAKPVVRREPMKPLPDPKEDAA